MATTTGRRAAGATMLALPLAAGLLMWSVAGDVIRPELDRVVAQVPGMDDAERDTVEVRLPEVAGYTFVASRTVGDAGSALGAVVDLPSSQARVVAEVHDDNGQVGVSVTVDDARRNTADADGVTNFRALVLGSSTIALTEEQVGAATMFVGEHDGHAVAVWQHDRGYSLLATPDARDLTAFAGALKASHQ